MPARTIGRIGGGRKRPTGRVDVAVIQSLVQNGVVDDLVEDYGQATDRGQVDWIVVRYRCWLFMSQVTFFIPDETLLALKTTREDLASRIRFAAAVKLYELGQLSSRAAAQLAGVPRPYFLCHLADYGVNTFDLSEEELAHDLKNA